MKTLDAAKGKWRGILMQLGMDGKFLTSKHGPCPLCGGTDRYRWDNSGGNGSYICGQCGAGTGMQLLMKWKGLEFKDAAKAVDEVIGNVSKDPPCKPALSDEKKSGLLKEMYLQSSPIAAGDLAWQYLQNRVSGVELDGLGDLRFHPDCPAPDGRRYPALLAVVRDCEGNGKTLHRTFLANGGVKADTDRVRALMPVPRGFDTACIQLGAAGKVLGVGEGIETALAARKRFGVTCWATINTTFMAKWNPPEGVEKVIVFGDCDSKFGGQAAAYTLAHRLSRDYEVEVNIPKVFGTDWADED